MTRVSALLGDGRRMSPDVKGNRKSHAHTTQTHSQKYAQNIHTCMCTQTHKNIRMYESTQTHTRTTTYTPTRAQTCSNTQHIRVRTRTNTQTRTHKHKNTHTKLQHEKGVAIESSTRDFALRDELLEYIFPTMPPTYGTLTFENLVLP